MPSARIQESLRLFIVLVVTFCASATLGSSVLAQSSAPAPIPELSLSVNDSVIPVVFQGWPVLIQLAITQSDSLNPRVPPLPINPLNGSWANTIQIQVTDASGIAQNWPIKLVRVPSGALTLGYGDVGQLFWTVSPSHSSAIAPGTYNVLAVINTTSSAGTSGWSGTAASDLIPIVIQPPISPLTQTQAEHQAQLWSFYHFVTGNSAQALTDLNSLLVSYPNSITGLSLKGDLLADLGQVSEAVSSYRSALTAFYAQNLQLQEPPNHLIRAKQTLESVLLSQTGLVGNPQISIALLDHGQSSPRVLFFDLQVTNIGTGTAKRVRFETFSAATTTGSGQVTYDATLSPTLPIVITSLAAGASSTVRIFLDVPSTVLFYSLTELGSFSDLFGTQTSFNYSQMLTKTGSLVGDVNGDGVVNCEDLAIVKASFGKKAGQPGFNPAADVNGDGVVNVLDLALVSKQIPAGTTCP
jgi:hypothetical protein